MKRGKILSLFSTTLICSSLLTTIPVSVVEAKAWNVSVNTSSQLEQKDKTVDNTVNYIKSHGIKVKTVIPEIGWIETDWTNQQQEKDIEKHTDDVQTPEKKANDSYTPTDIPSSSIDLINKYFWNTQWNMYMLTKNPQNFVPQDGYNN